MLLEVIHCAELLPQATTPLRTPPKPPTCIIICCNPFVRRVRAHNLQFTPLFTKAFQLYGRGNVLDFNLIIAPGEPVF